MNLHTNDYTMNIQMNLYTSNLYYIFIYYLSNKKSINIFIFKI